MNRLLSTSRDAVILLSFVLSWALSFSAIAVNLNSGEVRVNDGPSAVDTANYRSSSGRHKILLEGANADRAKSVQATRSHNYGSFQVLEVDRATADRLIAAGIASNADGHNLILFNTGAVDTTSPDVVANRSKALNMSSGKQLHLIQFPGPIMPEWYAQLEATGVEIVTPIPNNAYLVYGDAIALDNIATLADNRLAQWQGPYLASYKLQPGVATDAKTIAANLAKSLAPGAQGGTNDNVCQVQLIRDPSANALTEALFSAVPTLSRYEIKHYVNLVVTIAPELLDQVAKRPDVISIAKYVEPRLLDERQAMIVAGELTGNLPNPGNYFTKLSTWGLTQAQFTASGIVVDVTDDGADTNPAGGISQDSNTGPVVTRHFVLRESGAMANPSRFTYKGRWGVGTAEAPILDGGLGVGGHGQLNMSIIGGYVPDAFDTGNTQVHRDAQGYRYGLGIAPFVKLGNSVIFDPKFTRPSYPDLVSNAYANGARISSNSWGAAVDGAYDATSQTYDILVRDSQSGTTDNQQMLVVFSAGNDGPGARTIGTPGTGKNVLTVGAGENVRSHALAAGGAGVGADGSGINDTGADSANDIISFSSRGPTTDGRTKPDLVAPGTHVTGISFVAVGQDPTSPANGLGVADAAFRASRVSAMPGKGTAGNANNFFPLAPAQKWYTTSSGTSHSTPAVAGSAALIYQQFLNNPDYIGANRTPAGPAAPSPALVKAYLTNSARYMTGVSANDTLPSNNQGMGSVNLGTAFDGVQRIIRDQDATDRFTASGQVRTYFATVTSATAPLRVTLAYTDKEGPTIGNAFVNNLDLTVTVGGSAYKGNVFAGANSVTGGTADTRNNLESVFLPPGLAVGTTIMVQVTAANITAPADDTVASVNQDFALVMYNAISAPPQAFLSLSGTTLPTGNGIIEPNECNDLYVSLANLGPAAATAVGATLATSTPGVTIAQGSSNYPDIAPSGTAANLSSFKISTASSVACGSFVNLTQTVNFAGGAPPVSFPLSIQVSAPANTVLFSESFDGVVAPALPAGWATQNTGSTPPPLWATTATDSDSAPNAAFTNGSATVASNSLISPPIALPASAFAATLSFRHAWNFESGPSLYDGGILELSTDNGTTYNNVTSPAVGATFTAGGYTGVIFTGTSNPIAGQSGWGKTQATFVTSTLTLPTSLNGQTIKLRWRAGWDSDTAATDPNWRIDSVSLVGGAICTTGPGVCAASLPPNLAYSPMKETTVAFTGVTTIGTAGNASIAVAPSGGYGSGTAATSTVNACAFSGANAANFTGATAVNLSFVGTTTTAQNVGLTCTAGRTARTTTLSCSEKLGSGAATQRSWPLSCPVGNAPPQFGYTPATSATVKATGGTGVGSTGTMTITPSVATVGSGSSTAAITTLTCTAPTAPFSGFGQTVTATGSGAISGGPLSGSCTLGTTAQTQMLYCSENRGGFIIPPLSWALSCPAGNTPPNVAYNPTTGTTVVFTRVATPGSIGSGSIAVSPSGGSGAGATATTTVNGCTVAGGAAATFSGATAVNLSFVGSTTTAQTVALTCGSSNATRSTTLTCKETLGSAAPTSRSWPLSCPGDSSPPQFGYAPAPSTTVIAIGGAGVGSTGALTITPSIATAGSGSGTAGTTTLTCTLPLEPFSGFRQSLTATGSGAIAGGPLSGSCTLRATAQTQTLSCSENRGGTATAVSWTLACPVGNTPPILAYNPTTATTVAFTGVTTVGSTGNASIAVTPSGGSGTGASATSTVNGCTFSGADAANFTGAGAVNLSFVGATTVVQNVSLTCIPGSTARSAALQCSEKLGSAAATQRSWPLSCPVGDAPPQFGYTPATSATVNATGGTGVGSTGAVTITPSIATVGSGSGTAAITTLTCTAPTAPFSGFGQTVTATGSGAIAGGPLSGNCTLAATAQTQALSCSEKRGGTSVPVSWTLSCPVGCSLDVNGDGTVTADRDGVLLSRYLLGFRGGGLITDVPLGSGRADAAAVETFIGTAAQFDVFGRAAPAATAAQDGLVLIRLMLSVPDTALLGGIALPSGAQFTSASAVRANVNARCGTTY